MPDDPLLPDPESVEKWRNLPQNRPSRQALPPVMGGGRLNRALWLGFGVILLAAVILSWLLGR